MANPKFRIRHWLSVRDLGAPGLASETRERSTHTYFKLTVAFSGKLSEEPPTMIV
jgi:hypothetical protein